ncbi:hypothetical protein CYMTET_37580 [Cymbomonas tetramitiformis]|uniref:Ionotropic glutamate receptor C-terminal domain-containing protein n=1 Tax=Cymbomonas tetramitiformis TaxID=36881 RepID=A0AAE0CG06_9CHLO|nr:hypothetical protein CYMTET_37580 [Cymbomonas tetramitiformis]
MHRWVQKDVGPGLLPPRPLCKAPEHHWLPDGSRAPSRLAPVSQRVPRRVSRATRRCVALLISLLGWGQVPGGRCGTPLFSPVSGSFIGLHLRVATYGGDNLPFWIADEGPADTLYPSSFTGLIPTVLARLSTELGFTYDIYAWKNYGALYASRVNKSLDASIFYSMTPSSFTLDWPMARDIPMTYPLYQFPYGAVSLKTYRDLELWNFLQPFTWKLWLVWTSMHLLFATMLCILQAMQRDAKGNLLPRSSRFPNGAKIQLRDELYHSFASMLQGDAREWNTPPERTLRLGMLLLTLVMVATYTANLASFFTRPRVTLHGPKDLASMKYSKACTILLRERPGGVAPGDAAPGAPSALSRYVKELISPPPDRCGYGWSECAKKFYHEQLTQRKADVWIDPLDGLHSYVIASESCLGLYEIENIKLYHMSNSIHFRFHPEVKHAGGGALEMASNFSSAMLHQAQTPEYTQLLEDNFEMHRTCSSEVNSLDESVTLESMSGLLLVVSIVIALAFFLALLQRVKFSKWPKVTAARMHTIDSTRLGSMEFGVPIQPASHDVGDGLANEDHKVEEAR